jgi:hypothetical protein
MQHLITILLEMRGTWRRNASRPRRCDRVKGCLDTVWILGKRKDSLEVYNSPIVPRTLLDTLHTNLHLEQTGFLFHLPVSTKMIVVPRPALHSQNSANLHWSLRDVEHTCICTINHLERCYLPSGLPYTSVLKFSHTGTISLSSFTFSFLSTAYPIATPGPPSSSFPRSSHSPSLPTSMSPAGA